MIIGACEITLHLPDAHSLKDKRQIVKSVIARIRNQFDVSIAEVDENDRWQIAVIGVSCVSNSSQIAADVLERIQRFIEETRPDLQLTNAETEIIHW